MEQLFLPLEEVFLLLLIVCLQLLQQFLFSEACRLEQTHILLLRCQQFLRENHILQPAVSTLQRIIGEQRTASALPKDVDKKLDALLEVGDDTTSLLQQLKDPPGKASGAAMKRLTDKLAYIRWLF